MHNAKERYWLEGNHCDTQLYNQAMAIQAYGDGPIG